MQSLLVIDDEPGIRFSIEQVFERSGIEVLTADCAEEGMRAAGEKLPDVILLDIRLGRCSGLELFHELRRVDAAAAIIFITGHGTADTARDAKDLGAYDYLVKPLDVVQLQQLVHQALTVKCSVPATTPKPTDESLESEPSGAGCNSIAGWPRRFGPTLGVCMFLVLAVAIVFGQTLRHDFVNFDDDIYVYGAPRIIAGLTCGGVAWAFTHSHAGNWHPLTSISHMLDCQMYGLWPGGHHLTSVVFHAVTVVLLFLLLRRLTGNLWPSAFVAAVFAIHPLRAESVAWVAERKSVLSAMFFMLTIGTYAWYARRPFSLKRYLTVVVVFALGLMCKPSLVTLPFLLLLLDYWPLRRFNSSPVVENEPGRRRTYARLVVEKLPLLALIVPTCVTVLLMQRVGMQPLTVISPSARVANALMSYVAYLGQFFYPVNLAAFYPHPGNVLPIWKPAGAALVLIAVSAAAVVWRRSHPYLLIGWLWYLGMLVPVIGLVQVGQQQMADRYTYFSEIGIVIALAWGIAHLSRHWPQRPRVLSCAAALAIISLMAIACRQTSYWRDSKTLWTHALNCDPRNYVANLNLGNTAVEAGRIDEATRCYRRALEINPDYALAHCNLGQMLLTRGQVEEAVEHFQKALQSNPELAAAYYNLGNVAVQRRQLDKAISYYHKTLEIAPDFAPAHNNLGTVAINQGKVDEAIEHYRRALESNPRYAEACFNLACTFFRQSHVDEAIHYFRKALSIDPHLANASEYLALALSQQRKTASASAAHR